MIGQRAQIGIAAREFLMRRLQLFSAPIVQEHIKPGARPFKAIEPVEARILHRIGTALVEHQKVRFEQAAAAYALLPEELRHQIAHIAAIAVHIELLDEISHISVHILAQRGISVIQLREAPHACVGRAVRAAHDVVGMRLQEHRRRAAVEIHQIQHDLHAQRVRMLHKRAERVIVAVFRIDCKIVLHAIGVARIVEASLLLALAPILEIFVVIRLHNGAEIHHVRAQCGDFLQMRLGGAQRAFPRHGAQKNLIDDHIVSSLCIFREPYSQVSCFRSIVAHRAEYAPHAYYAFWKQSSAFGRLSG